MSSARPPPGRLAHVALSVADLGRMERFYVDVLGFRVQWRPDPANVYLTTGEDNLALHAVDDLSVEKSQLDHLGLVVESLQAVDAWAVYLEEQGVTLAKEPRTHRDGSRSIYLRDPEGNMIQVLFHPEMGRPP